MNKAIRLIIAVLAASILAILSPGAEAGQNKGPIESRGVLGRLTEEQKAYLARNPILVVGAVGAWPPFEMKERDEITGLSPELLGDLAHRLGLQVRFRIFQDLNEMMRTACEGGVDVVMNLSLSAERTRCFVYTEPYAEAPIGIVARPGDPQLRDDPDLAGVRLVSNSGTATERLARERFPLAIHISASSIADGIRLVAERKADAYLGDSQVATRVLLVQGFEDLALVRPSDLPYDLLHYAVPNSKQPLAEVLNIALASMTAAEREAYSDRWLVKLSWFDRGEFSVSAQEAQILSQPLRVGWPAGFASIAYADSDGQPTGLAGEYLRRLRLAGAQFRLVEPMPWPDLRQAIKDGSVDVVFGVPRDSAWLGDGWLLSKPFVSVANVIVAPRGSDSIHSIADLNGLTAVVSDPSRVSRYIQAGAPQATVTAAPSAAAALQRVASGEADVYVGNLAVADALISSSHAGALEIVASAGFQDELSIAVQRRYAPLISVFNRVLAQMEPGEQQALRNRWLPAPYTRGVDWGTVLRWLVPLLGILVTAIIVQAWNQLRLSREVLRRKETEVKLDDARQLAERAARAKSEFLATMSHEIRTPMSAVMGMVELLEESDLDRPQREILAVVSDSAGSLRLLLDDILDVSRMEGGGLVLNPSPTSIRRLVSSVSALMEPMATRKRIGWSVQVGAEVGEVHLVDELRLRQVLINLIGNSIKFTSSGSVSVDIQMLSQCSERQTLRFAVRDTGVGMSEEERSRVAEPFSQATAATAREYGGAGLGLAIVTGLLELMEAELRIHSAVAFGTEISFELSVPIVEDLLIEQVEVQASLPLPGSWRVLVAEDDPANLILMRHRLHVLGVDAVLVGDGEEALSAMRSSGPFDVVITDCQMPRMDGYALTRAIRAEEQLGVARRPVLAMTASASAETRRACAAAGVDRVLLKPFDMLALRMALSRLLSIEQSNPSDDRTAVAVQVDDVRATWHALVRSLGAADVARKVVDALHLTFHTDLSALRRAIHEGDIEVVRRLVHRTAGGVGMVGFGALSADGQRLEADHNLLSHQALVEMDRFLGDVQEAIDGLAAYANKPA